MHGHNEYDYVTTAKMCCIVRDLSMHIPICASVDATIQSPVSSVMIKGVSHQYYSLYYDL